MGAGARPNANTNTHTNTNAVRVHILSGLADRAREANAERDPFAHRATVARPTVMAGWVGDGVDGAPDTASAGLAVDGDAGRGYLVGPQRPRKTSGGQYDPFRALGGYEGVGASVTMEEE